MAKTRSKKLTTPEARQRLAGPVQDRSPVASWSGPGLCPPPPEMSMPGALRGQLAARSERLKTIAELDEIVTNDLDFDAREPERALRRWALDRYLQAEAEDPSPRYARPQTAAPAPAFEWDEEAARAALRRAT
jgi:hypothetical protein